ncbi:hypothetical protein SD70_07310 [Gordoniibacillus kamchatkensis]|uniref:Uncharacterized protein n=1 Tax=Gordoniibacillus kamchatkensis TaxID=1590651 RepID=A0ABR5AKA1_9BACL|nr:hypothetical protein [Paenibacillus sp. VKM B-2647]KIL41439.1 hypothetical protein SD70_07310 [Paenibacillus sp. VKM B-2647]
MKMITLQRKAATEGGRLFSVMNAIAWLVLGIGLLLCLINISEFTDQNLGLMIGIGCLIASVQIYVVGTVVHLLQNNAKQQ